MAALFIPSISGLMLRRPTSFQENQTCEFVFADGKEGKNKDNAGASSSSASAAKPRVKSSSSIAGIALCWQGVVQRQVTTPAHTPPSSQVQCE